MAQQRNEQERRMREDEDAWQRQQAKLDETELEAKGSLVLLDDDGEVEQDVRLSDGDVDDELEDEMASDRRREDDGARSIGSKRASPVLSSQLDTLVTSSHVADEGKEDWDVVPL